ncbi:MAG: cupin domain-containing protein [Burkholderiaceae bacterium]|nr:cupin domain-containing protein [Burkholderiaceae bacterium]
MNATNLKAFEAEAVAQGYDLLLERRWAPGTTLDVHTHPFDARALMVEGEMWLTVGSETRHLRAGDTFELDRHVPHSERYGDQGAVFWVARRSGQSAA